MPIFDTHAHYDSGGFNADREEILSALPGAGVALVVNPGCDVPSSRAAAELAERFPHVYAAAGIHPEDCAGCTDADFESIRKLCAHEKVVAVGEIGLDYYWRENPPREFQERVFRRQIELALELDLPVIVHDRDAHGDCLDLVRAFPNTRGVFHCYSGAIEEAKLLLDRGWYLGFDGPVTFKNARRAPEVVRFLPLDRLLLETDSPYMAPVPHRGKRNDSRNLPFIAAKIAELKGLSPEAVEQAAWDNANRFFGLEG